MELLQEIAVDSVGPQQCQRNPAARPVRVFRFLTDHASQCVHRRSFDLIISHYLARSD